LSWYRNNLKMKPTYRKKNLLDYFFGGFRSTLKKVKAMEPGLPIRNCAGSSNNLVPRGTKVSAIDVTQREFFERLYWFQDRAHLSLESTVRVLPHHHCSPYNYFSISVQFFRMWPLIFCQHTIHQIIWPSPGTLVKAHCRTVLGVAKEFFCSV